MTKYIFVTGGVVSSLGKGIAAASIGMLLKNRGLSVAVLKMDPYINMDPGLMSPYQHGEVFVTEDGAETDLDLGHYERFIDINVSKHSSVSTGKIYWSVLNKERRGEYKGNTVQIIPHITNEIKERIQHVADSTKADIVIVEIGGTIGDIESLPFLEAIRQFKSEKGPGNAINVHLALVPHLKVANESKTKPVQHSVKELRSLGIRPEIVLCRTEVPLTQELINKIALFCDIEPEAVKQSIDIDTIYKVPLNYKQEGVDELIVKKLALSCKEPDISYWENFLHSFDHPKHSIRVAVVGKYTEFPDAYISIVEALKHAGFAHYTRINIDWVNAKELEQQDVHEMLKDADAIIVPDGSGTEGNEGKIKTIRYARENEIPFLGICLGMQLAVVEFARNVVGLKGANSTEFGPCEHPVVDFAPDTTNDIGNNRIKRLGALPCVLAPFSRAYNAYGTSSIMERHRHNFSFNNAYKDEFHRLGMISTGLSLDQQVIEVVELLSHPWFVGVQFLPELKSRPNHPHPLFKGLVESALTVKKAAVNV